MKSIWIFKLGLRSLLNSISKTKQSNFLWHFLKTLNWFSFKRWLLPWASMKFWPMNVRSLKSREHFCLVKDTILHNGFDIFIVSETWADLSVSDASLEISSYQLFRQDRGQHKAGGGLCTYAKSNLKITVLENLSSACDDDFQQLWLRVQCRKYKSFLICNTYRPPQTPSTCFESLANSLTDALLLDLNVVILGDLNCNLLAPDPETTSLQTFISTFNLH